MGELTDRISGKAKQVEGVLSGSRWRQAQGLMDELKGKVKGVARRTGATLTDLARKVRRAVTGRPA